MRVPLVIDDLDVHAFSDIASGFGQQRFGYVVTPNADHLIRLHDEERFRRTYQDAAYTLLDSQLLARAFRLFRSVRLPVCTGSDVTAQLFSRVMSTHDEIVLIGGSADQARTLRETYGLTRLHHQNPPMGFIHDPGALETTLQFIEKRSPFRFCLLAVGSPQQELLAHELHRRGRARGLALCVGAAVNFLTGVEQRAPRWLQRNALEWAYRLLREPRRLARRYLLRGPRVFFLLEATALSVRSLATVPTACARAPAPHRPPSNPVVSFVELTHADASLPP